MVEFKELKKTNSEIEFKVKNIDTSILNSIRRIILSEIENVAFEFEPYKTENPDINIIKNTSPLHNEFIKHRLSLIPLCFDVNEINDFDKNKYKFIIQQSNNTNSLLDVHTGDIQIHNEDGKPYSKSFREKIFPKNPITNDYILITKLKPNLIKQDEGNEIYIQAIASKNIAKNYSGYGIVSTCVYYNIVDEDKADKILKEKIKELSDKKNLNTKDEIAEYKKDFINLEKQKYFHKNDYDEPNYFQYTITSECRIPSEYLFFKSILIINQKINKIIELIIKEENSFKYLDKTIDMYELNITEEKHTIGNLLQSLMYNKYVREERKNLIKFIGYRCPHPLENHLFIRLQINNENEDFKNTTNQEREKLINKIFVDGCEEIQNDLNNINKKWIEFSKIKKELIKEFN
jgi:DNA-directed RNA polymerase II subunit RPB3